MHLQRRDLARAEACLDEAQAVPTEDEDHAAILSLLRLELRLAQDPVGAAPALVRSLEERRGVFAEELGLRAHAKALAGLDPSSDLAELAHLEELGWLRLGLPWHGFGVGRVIAGAAWWPGVPR